ncbi:MAG TPA: transporter, partial [Terriglobia bacterium]|nr:transporter [Terriglobia bacterium]
LAIYEAGKLRNAQGNTVPATLFHLFGLVDGLGISYTTRISAGSTFLTMSIGMPIAHVALDFPDRLQAGIDRFGFADPYIQPIRLGWRHERADIVTSYGIYLPTGRSNLAGGKGVSSGGFTHEFSGGGSVYFKDRSRFVTALTSYQMYTRQRGIDVRRGDTLQVQGGVGTKVLGESGETGLASYALWQTRDHSGTALPAALRTARDRVFGVGPEAAVMLKPIRAQIRIRYEWDLGVRARPQGHIFVAGITFLVRSAPARGRR